MARIEELIASVEARGIDSPYLSRLRQRRDRAAAGAGLEALKREILAEIAASLGRAEDHVNEALLRLDVLDRELRELGAPEELDAAGREAWCQKAEAFNAQRAVAEKRLWELTVQRECIGIRRHEQLALHYPIPPAKRLP